MPQVVFDNVTKEYEPDFKALDSVSFTIEPGEFVFLVGHSGAGKSTLIKMLIREDEPTIGQVLFNEMAIPYLTKEELPGLRRKIGVVFQDFKVLDSKNVFENVAVALDVVDAPDYVINEVVPNVLGLVGLHDKAYRFPSQLSGGELQRLSIARALAHEPDMLIADEPTGMIDPQAAQQVLEILNKINSLGTTILMSTHDYSVVNRMQKRVLRLNKGQLISDRKQSNYDD
jgi:cell division transport system ATP-binding protein